VEIGVVGGINPLLRAMPLRVMAWWDWWLDFVVGFLMTYVYNLVVNIPNSRYLHANQSCYLPSKWS
jgi:hypothetical protein